jgi:hypothetical protein
VELTPSCEISAKPSIPAKNISWTLRNKNGSLLTPIKMGKSNVLWHGANNHLKAQLSIRWSALGNVPQNIIGESGAMGRSRYVNPNNLFNCTLGNV